jgi:hypothetical protein
MPPTAQYAERQQNQLVEVAEHGDEVGDQVDRAQGVGDEGRAERLGVPRHTRVAARHVANAEHRQCCGASARQAARCTANHGVAATPNPFGASFAFLAVTQSPDPPAAAATAGS